MEMSFPPKGYAKPAGRARRDHRALLATAIARQAAGWTSRAMILSASSERRTLAGDAVEQRIHYFSSRREGSSSIDLHGNGPFGAFFPSLNLSPGGKPNSEQDVYHSGSTIGKGTGLELATVELQPEIAGHGVSRKL